MLTIILAYEENQIRCTHNSFPSEGPVYAQQIKTSPKKL
jgi:hypothetical protein